MKFHLQHRQWRYALAAALLPLTACVTTSAPESAAVTAVDAAEVPRQLDDLVLVDCQLPGQIRQLGTRMTYLAPRRWIKTTQSDCGIRGGEFVLFDRSDYATALRTLLPKAEAGDPVAQTYVGEIYEKGLGLPAPDHAAAVRWYRRAADNGYRPAQVNLGVLYERGQGVAQDRAAALEWYRRALGLVEDRLVFESTLEAEREAFAREIALRNRIAATLRHQLQQARAARPPANPPAAPIKPPVAPVKKTAPSPIPDKAPSAALPPPAEAAAGPAAPATMVANKRALERIAESLHRDAASQAEQVQRELHALEQVRQTVQRDSSAEASKKVAQMGKLELNLRQHADALAENAQRLTMLLP